MHRGDIHREGIYIQRDIYTEGTYTQRDIYTKEIYTQKGHTYGRDIYMERIKDIH